MTLQQLKYVIAVNKHRNFAKAAEACEVTQPTLSAMLQKLESELNVRIFERTNKAVVPTPVGQKIIRQAEKTLSEAAVLEAIVGQEKDTVSGELNLSAGPTISPYILPAFIKAYNAAYPDVQLKIRDLKISSMLNALLDGSLDAGIGISGNMRRGILEIPLYFDPVVAYVGSKAGAEKKKDFLWVMKEALSLRESAFSYYKADIERFHIYESSNLETLIRMVDTIGGRTVIPQMHIRFLSPEQRKRVVEMAGDENYPVRHFSLYVKSDYMREKMFNSLVTTLKRVIPAQLLEPGMRSL
ncbi:MAG: LysR family transcriptional regulator [Bacteroidales bacterium]|nr:LysR family transcriptional regulator [Bacteroidales bacterium]